MAVAEQRAALSTPCCILIRSMMIPNIGVKEGISLSAAFILSSFAFTCACSYLTVIEECRPIRSFLVRKRPDFPDLEQVVPSSMADAVRKEICNNSEEETAHVSVSLPGLFGLTITKTLKC